MWMPLKLTTFIVIIITFSVFIVIVSTKGNDSKPKEKHPREEYETIFKNIPKLFQHLIEVVEEKPEVLEKNDVTVFKRDVSYPKGVSRKKRGIHNDVNIVPLEIDVNTDSKRSEGNMHGKVTVKDDQIDKETHSILENKDTIEEYREEIRRNHNQRSNNKENANVETQNYQKDESKGKDIKEYSEESNKYRNKRSKKEEGTKKDEDYHIDFTDIDISNENVYYSKDYSDEFEEAIFLGAVGLDGFRLSPEEISENAIKVEKMLEEHNKR